MSLTKIAELTPKQKALIPAYNQKWKAIALSTEPIDRHKATEAVKAAYTLIGKAEPEIVFFDSPYGALDTLIDQLENRPRVASDKLQKVQPGSKRWERLMRDKRELAENLVGNQLEKQLKTQLPSQRIDYQTQAQEWYPLLHQLANPPWSYLKSQLGSQFYDYCICPLVWARDSSWFDFCINVLNEAHDPKTWDIFQSIVKHCGWFFPFEATCIICDRPIKISFDRENRLHAEGKPAIEFADGYKFYYYHGVALPKKYGRPRFLHWQAKWLLKERNAELRRVLIQGIGYERICKELQVNEMDSWQEYTLLRIDNELDIEPIYLLKMICPSTGYIHATRVPPDMRSAREAICWVNWGTDPEEFQKQT